MINDNDDVFFICQLINYLYAHSFDYRLWIIVLLNKRF